ncbi:MAG TPA: hypothetical protein PKD92_00105 [Novosphingobium sp.]|nr:hypothetical protein [Novosphingobium sp.]
MDFPAEPADLLAGGTAFLTAAFRRSGVLGPDNAVRAITRFDELAVGGTGRKVILSVAYERAGRDLPEDLFVKFSRNSADPLRDRLRHHMREEIMLALVSRDPAFPVPVPRCMFADFHADSGTGVLITARVPYGEGGVEPCHVKCQDYRLADALDHYRAIVEALARLAGAVRAGACAETVDRFFPASGPNIFTRYRLPKTLDDAMAKVDRIEAFGRQFPGLLYPGKAPGALFGKLRADLPFIYAHEAEIRAGMHRDDAYVSVCHFNANIDNAWFWRDADGKRQCGLLDWGMVGRMHVGMALWGSLSAAEAEVCEHHLGELVALFVQHFRAASGVELDRGKLERDMALFGILMGLSVLFDAPARALHEIPGLRADASRFDREFDIHENARVQLHILNNVLRIWESFDFARCDGIGSTAG